MQTIMSPTTLNSAIMAGRPQLAHTPLQAMSTSLFSAATGLRSSQDGTLGVLDLTPSLALRNFVDMLCKSSPQLGRIILTLGPFLVLSYGLYSYVWTGCNLSRIVDKITSRFAGKVTIPASNILHGQILAWMAKHDVGTDMRSLTVHSPVPRVGGVTVVEDELVPHRQALSYVPAIGSSVFYWNSHKLKFHRDENRTEQLVDASGRDIQGATKTRQSDIIISAFHVFGGVEIVRAFLDHVDKTAVPEIEASTVIYRISRYLQDGELWDRGISRPPRGLESVTMETEKKERLVKELTEYLDKNSKIWYANRGVPWRKGFLLYGPPGTGKTSFSVAVAGHFNLDIYIVSMSNPDLTDDILEGLFDSLPGKCVVLMEDVDSAGIQRESMKSGMSLKSRKKNKLGFGKGVSLSALLNVIDGPCSIEGRILCLTSNSPDSLDPALIRPGRIDRKILFGNASREVMEKMFMHIFSSFPGENKSDAEEEHDLLALSKVFAAQMPEDKLTPAEIQNFLLVNRDDVLGAMEKVAGWAEEVVTTKEMGKNVAGFTGQIAASEEDGVLVNGDDHNDDESESEDEGGETALHPPPPPPPPPPGYRFGGRQRMGRPVQYHHPPPHYPSYSGGSRYARLPPLPPVRGGRR